MTGDNIELDLDPAGIEAMLAEESLFPLADTRWYPVDTRVKRYPTPWDLIWRGVAFLLAGWSGEVEV